MGILLMIMFLLSGVDDVVGRRNHPGKIRDNLLVVAQSSEGNYFGQLGPAFI
jgi:hypothetical protein